MRPFPSGIIKSGILTNSKTSSTIWWKVMISVDQLLTVSTTGKIVSSMFRGFFNNSTIFCFTSRWRYVKTWRASGGCEMMETDREGEWGVLKMFELVDCMYTV